MTYQSANNYAKAQQQKAQARTQAQCQEAIQEAYAQATGLTTSPRSRERQNLLRNWGAALFKTFKHVCTTAVRVGKQISKSLEKIDRKAVGVVVAATIVATL